MAATGDEGKVEEFQPVKKNLVRIDRHSFYINLAERISSPVPHPNHPGVSAGAVGGLTKRHPRDVSQYDIHAGIHAGREGFGYHDCDGVADINVIHDRTRDPTSDLGTCC